MIEQNQNTEFTLITGASSGIGRHIATQLSRNFNLILNGTNEKRLMETFSQLDSSHSHLIFKYDLSLVDQLENVLNSFLTENKVIVGNFIHCAGFMELMPLRVQRLETLLKTFNVNTVSAILLTKVLIQKKTNHGTLKNIIFISSNISNFGAKAFGGYAASKAALDAFMRCMAVELAPAVRVNSVLPGAVRTEMTENIFSNQEVVQRMENSYPLGTGKVQDIFGVIKFLLSDESRWITGQQFIVDGGRTINISA